MDELQELRWANPISVEQASELVATDKQTVVDSLRDDADLVPIMGERVARTPKPASRWTSAIVAAAAAIVLVVVGVNVVDRLDARGVVEASVAAPAPDGDSVLLDVGGRRFDRTTDLLVVHFDYAEPGDVHAAVAAREVATWFNLDPIVVVGSTSGDPGPAASDYVRLMNAAWDDRWLDANQDRSNALTQTLERSLDVLGLGGHVWVAQGGSSGFTAELVREIQRLGSSVDTPRAVHVLQAHDMADGGDEPSFVQVNTAYEPLDRGGSSQASLALEGLAADFEAAVLSGCHEQRWATAFAQVPSADLDLSETALLLQILDVGPEHVASAEDFAAFFIGDQPDAKMRGDS